MSDQPAVPAASQATPSPGQPVRSEGLLPADQADPNLQVAEEVSLDLQSDQARRVGAMPPDTEVSQAAAAVAETLKPESTASGSDLHQSLELAVPPSP